MQFSAHISEGFPGALPRTGNIQQTSEEQSRGMCSVSDAIPGLKHGEPGWKLISQRGPKPCQILAIKGAHGAGIAPLLVGMNLKTTPTMTDSMNATMKRTDENDSPIASDACSSHPITGIILNEPSRAAVLAMFARERVEPVCKASASMHSRSNAVRNLDRQNGRLLPSHFNHVTHRRAPMKFCDRAKYQHAQLRKTLVLSERRRRLVPSAAAVMINGDWRRRLVPTPARTAGGAAAGMCSERFGAPRSCETSMHARELILCVALRDARSPAYMF